MFGVWGDTDASGSMANRVGSGEPHSMTQSLMATHGCHVTDS